MSRADEAFEPSLDWCRAKRGTKWSRPGPDAVPAWVADMDFAPCPPVAAAIAGLVERGDLGYPDWDTTPLAEPFAERMGRLHGWHLDPAEVRHVSDLIQAFAVTVELGSRPGDAVAAHVPNYPPFLAQMAGMDRPLVGLPMEPDGASWSFDAERLEADVVRRGVRVLLVVNPHNPTGRVLTRTELEALAAVACRHDLLVLADEIHAELIYDGRSHVPIASLDAEIAARTVTMGSASKSFNLAGLRTGVVHVGPGALRQAWDRLPSHFLGSPNVAGVEATLAAWSDGDPWLAALRRHLGSQRDHLGSRLAELPGVSWRPPEGTYLAWLDCRQAPVGDEEPAAFFRRRARVELNSGPDYGPGGQGHARLNFATGRAILDEIVDRMRDSLDAASS